MHRRLLLLLAVFGAISAQPQKVAPDPRETRIDTPAKLVGPGVAFYVEARQPGKLVQETAGLLSGCALDDFPFGLGRLREKGFEADYVTELAGLLLTPDGVKEAQLFKSAALAFQPPTADGTMPYVLLLQPGDSRLPELLIRRSLSNQGVEAAEEVEGVAIHRVTTHPGVAAAGPGNQRAIARFQQQMMQQMRRLAQQQIPGLQFPSPGSHTTDYALLPGLVVIGAPSLVKEAVTRAKSKGPCLADAPAFQQASKDFGNRPGLFLYGNPKQLAEAIEQLEAVQRPAWAELLRQLGKPAAFQSMVGSLTIDNSIPLLHFDALIGEGKCPLAEAVPTTPFKPELLHFVPPSMEAVVGLVNPDGAKRWEKLLEIADALAKAADVNKRLPSRQADRLEDDLKIKFGPDVAAKIAQVVVAQGAEKRSPSTAPPLLFLLEAVDEDAARSLVGTAAPKVIEALLGQRIVPTIKEVKGRTLHTADLGSLGALSFGRHGLVVAVGNDPDLVAEALNLGEKRQGILGEARVQSALAEVADAGAIVLARPNALADLLRGEGYLLRQLSSANSLPVERTIGGIQFAIGGVGPVQPPQQPLDRADDKANFALAPLALGIKRTGDRVVLEGRLTEPRPALPRLVDILLERQVEGAWQPFAGAAGVPAVIQVNPFPVFPPGGQPLPAQAPVPVQPPPLPR